MTVRFPTRRPGIDMTDRWMQSPDAYLFHSAGPGDGPLVGGEMPVLPGRGVGTMNTHRMRQKVAFGGSAGVGAWHAAQAELRDRHNPRVKCDLLEPHAVN